MSSSKKSHNCPICDKTFTTEKGKKQHLSHCVLEKGKKQNNIARNIYRSTIQLTENSDDDGSVQQILKKQKKSEQEEPSLSIVEQDHNFSDLNFSSSSTDEFVSTTRADDNSESNLQGTKVLLAQEKTYQMNSVSTRAYKSGHDLAERDLLKINADAYAHNNLYNKIIDWARKWNKRGVYFDDPNYQFCKRSVVIDRLSKSYNMENMKPLQTQIQLQEKDGFTTVANITTFDFQQQLLSLLRDETLMDPSNLAIDYPLNKKPTFPRSEISEIKDSLWYENAYQYYDKKCNNDPSRLICGIILAIDKTHTDEKGKLCLESVNFSLSIFNTKTRRTNPRAWRSLGFVNDMNAKFGISDIEQVGSTEFNPINVSADLI